MQQVSSETCALIILNYNGWENTLACLKSLAALKNRPRHTIVVDNGSTDDSIATIVKSWPEERDPVLVREEDLQNSPHCPEAANILLACAKNGGYARGNNQGLALALRDAQCNAFWILNNDTEPDPAALECLCAALNANAGAGIAGSTQVFAGSDKVQCAGGGAVNRWLGSTRSLEEFCPLSGVLLQNATTVARRLDFIAGASMLVRREVFDRVGLIPEEYFLYYEDVDFGVSAKKAGFQLVWARDGIVVHHDNGSTRARRSAIPAWIDFLILRNRMYFVKKHFALSIPTATFGYAGVARNRIRRGQSQRLKIIFPAIMDALLGKMGMSERAKKIARADVQTNQQPSEQTELKFSLVVATYKRVTPLERLLQSLREQTCKRFEIIIVDQNPEGFLDPTLQSFADLPIQVLRAEPEGVSRARNIGLRQAAGDIVGFPDDDCWYAPDALATINDLFCRHGQFAGLLVSWSDAATPGNCPTLSRLNRINAFSRGETYVQFYRKEAVSGILFDPDLGPGTGLPYGSGEDTDFLLQVLSAGHTVGRSSNVLIYHPKVNLADPRLREKATAYACGRMRLLHKHKFPLWFKLATVVFPLVAAVREGRAAWPYRWAMFTSRLKGLF